MEHIDNTDRISPVRLSMDSTFEFQCHPGVRCFTDCCRGIHIILTPYDIIRMKKRLDLGSEEFLTLYTEPHLLEKTDLPMVTLKLMDDERKSCPFVRSDGCIIYHDRPTTCRYYPLGVASLQHREGADDEGFFFFIHEDHCKGFEEKKIWSVKEWRINQGVDIHDEINSEWTDLIVRKRSFPPNVKLSDQAKQMFFMVSYNIDKFREFVFNSTFLERYDVNHQEIDAIRKDDTALFRFGVNWLTGLFFAQSNRGLKGKPFNTGK